MPRNIILLCQYEKNAKMSSIFNHIKGSHSTRTNNCSATTLMKDDMMVNIFDLPGFHSDQIWSPKKTALILATEIASVCDSVDSIFIEIDKRSYKSTFLFYQLLELVLFDISVASNVVLIFDNKDVLWMKQIQDESVKAMFSKCKQISADISQEKEVKNAVSKELHSTRDQIKFDFTKIWIREIVGNYPIETLKNAKQLKEEIKEIQIRVQRIHPFLDRLYNVSIAVDNVIWLDLNKLISLNSKSADPEASIQHIVELELEKIVVIWKYNHIGAVFICLAIQIRIIASIAIIRGYDVKTEPVKTLILAILVGLPLSDYVTNFALGYQFISKFEKSNSQKSAADSFKSVIIYAKEKFTLIKVDPPGNETIFKLPETAVDANLESSTDKKVTLEPTIMKSSEVVDNQAPVAAQILKMKMIVVFAILAILFQLLNAKTLQDGIFNKASAAKK